MRREDWPARLLTALVLAYDDPSDTETRGQGIDGFRLGVLAGLIRAEDVEAHRASRERVPNQDSLYWSIDHMKHAGWIIDDSLLRATVGGVHDNIRPSRQGIEVARELMRPLWAKALLVLSRYTGNVLVGALSGAAGGALAALIIHLLGLT